MQLSLCCCCCVWILTLHTAAQQPGGSTQMPGVRTQRPGVGATPRPLDANKPETVRGTRGKVGRGRTPLDGPHVCGGRCCVGWTLSPRTRRCTKPRCVPRCHSTAWCRQPNRCVCRRGFRGKRCELSTPAFVPPRHAIAVATASTSRPEPEPGDPSPPFILSAEVPDAGRDKSARSETEDVGGVSKVEENQMSPKRPPVGRRAPRPQTPQSQGPQEASKTEDKILIPQSGSGASLSSISWSHAEPRPPLDVEETSETEDQRLTPLATTPLTVPTVESNSRLRGADGLNSEAGGAPRGRETAGDGVAGEEKTRQDGRDSGEEEEKKKKKKKKTEEVMHRGAKKQPLSLREAQAVLLRKTLSRGGGGGGDKMAALLMKHIEKERKKVLVETSVKTFFTQKGQYTVHVSAEPGQSLSGSCRTCRAEHTRSPSCLVKDVTAVK
ncbi:hypothetical protein PFLUV_G00015000 [Perca fluviatilis]|uniref:EGF-like domain-containing protein n=1 Tax=Perca fluviatilis TaxID=8168 RepID=A0A6A5EUW1_PERFL|nr:hypothetical protein PFLUV_G00015000 [Perca fluviatilis]